MYWNNTWVNNFNKQFFLNKTLFLESLISFLFSEKIFNFFFFKKITTSSDNVLFFKNSFLKKIKNKNILIKKTKTKQLLLKNKKGTFLQKTNLNKYNFTRIWLIKYNNYILLSTFVYFYIKVKPLRTTSFKKLKNKSLPKLQTIFWKKKRGFNKKRFKINLNIRLSF